MIKPTDFKRWRNLKVDVGLEDSWLERLNALRIVKILGTCSGHDDAKYWTERWPVVWFRVPGGRTKSIQAQRAKLADKIICRLARLRYTHVQARVAARARYGTLVHVHHPVDGGGPGRDKRTRQWWEDVIAALEAVQEEA